MVSWPQEIWKLNLFSTHGAHGIPGGSHPQSTHLRLRLMPERRCPTLITKLTDMRGTIRRGLVNVMQRGDRRVGPYSLGLMSSQAQQRTSVPGKHACASVYLLAGVTAPIPLTPFLTQAAFRGLVTGCPCSSSVLGYCFSACAVTVDINSQRANQCTSVSPRWGQFWVLPLKTLSSHNSKSKRESGPE